MSAAVFHRFRQQVVIQTGLRTALQPGEEKTVTFTITPEDLQFYDDKAGNWKAEPGKFKLYIGASSTDIRSTVPFELL